ncbi:unnamed protein product, partial [Symbiodinium sp. CCMP2456]
MVRRWLLSEVVLELAVVDDIQIGKGSKTSLSTGTFVKWLMFSTPPLSLASDEDANKAE